MQTWKSRLHRSSIHQVAHKSTKRRPEVGEPSHGRVAGQEGHPCPPQRKQKQKAGTRNLNPDSRIRRTPTCFMRLETAMESRSRPLGKNSSKPAFRDGKQLFAYERVLAFADARVVLPLRILQHSSGHELVVYQVLCDEARVQVVRLVASELEATRTCRYIPPPPEQSPRTDPTRHDANLEKPPASQFHPPSCAQKHEKKARSRRRQPCSGCRSTRPPLPTTTQAKAKSRHQKPKPRLRNSSYSYVLHAPRDCDGKSQSTSGGKLLKTRLSRWKTTLRVRKGLGFC